jgi:glycosyl transferase, family 25
MTAARPDRSPAAALPVFIINLERDVPRREHMQTQLAQIGLPAEFVAAVDGRTLSATDRSAYDLDGSMRIYGGEMRDPEIACYLSHYRLYERIVRENIPVALIMEDDLDINPALPRILDDLLAAPAPRWLVVRLESVRGPVRFPKNAKFRGKSVQRLRDGELCRLGTHVLGLGAYLIRREGAERMLAYGRRIVAPIDHTMDRYWENGILPYLVRPIPVWQIKTFPSHLGERLTAQRRQDSLTFLLRRKSQRAVDSLRKRLVAIRTFVSG